MTLPATAGRAWTDWVWRTGLVLTALALALAVGAEFRDLQAAREAAFTWMAQSGIPLDTAPLDREPDPERVMLRAARAVLTAELDPVLTPASAEGMPGLIGDLEMHMVAGSGHWVC